MSLDIYVDALMPTQRSRRWPFDSSCHCFHRHHDLDALETFVLAIGCQLHWLDRTPGFPHFDLTPGMRAKAVKAGAIEITCDHPVMREMFVKRREVLKALAALKEVK